ncbi:MAG: FG-GAP repeat protein [Planctomycetes bacterium]|nr:FG-GAP repeat protein [Planctomycetota bacterium]
MHRFSRATAPLAAPFLLLLAPAAQAQLSHSITYGEQWTERHGHAIANVGDLDGDGRDNLVVGSPWWDAGITFSCGRVYVYPEVGNGGPLYAIDGTQTGAQFGHAICGVGDVDGDGAADFVVGSPYWNTSTLVDAGKLELFSGATGALLRTLTGSAANEKLGLVLAPIGDLNGDGKPEVLCGEPGPSQVKIVSHNLNVLNTIFRGGDVEFGTSVSRTGDIDGDGVDEILVGEPNYDTLVPFVLDRGRVAIYSGATLAFIDHVLGASTGDRMGESCAATGDHDSDGVDDFLCGSTVYGATDLGLVIGVSGATRVTFFRAYGTAAGVHMGHAITSIPDLDRDGLPEVAATELDGGALGTGKVFIWSGADFHVLWSFEGWSDAISTSEQLGYALAAGNWNGDEYGDFVWTDPLHDANFLDGAGFIERGVTIAHVGCPAWTEEYGSGLAGTNGIPHLIAQDAPHVGGDLNVLVENSLGAPTLAALFLGVDPASTPFKGGTLLVDPALTLIFPLDAGGTVLTGDIEYDVALYFAEFYVQVAEVDAGAVKKLSLTPGLKIHCGLELL